MQPKDMNTRGKQAILPDGTPNYGAHLGRLDRVDLENLFKTGEGASLWLRFREKRWYYIGIIHPRLILGCAVIHLGYLGSAFAFAYDRRTRKLTEHNMVAPPLGQIIFDRHPDKGKAKFRAIRGVVELNNKMDENRRLLNIDLFYPGSSLKAQITVFDEPRAFLPLQMITPMENSRCVFTHKAAGLAAEGTVWLPGEKIVLRQEETKAILDWTNGYHLRRTFWNWACGTGVSEEGKSIGFNLSTGVYTGGVLENVVWIEGKPSLIGEVVFEYNKDAPRETWRIVNQDSSVKLRFEPEEIRGANQSFGLIASRFIQPCGKFSGLIRDDQGNIHNFQEVGGVVEEHYAKW